MGEDVEKGHMYTVFLYLSGRGPWATDMSGNSKNKSIIEQNGKLSRRRYHNLFHEGKVRGRAGYVDALHCDWNNRGLAALVAVREEAEGEKKNVGGGMDWAVFMGEESGGKAHFLNLVRMLFLGREKKVKERIQKAWEKKICFSKTNAGSWVWLHCRSLNCNGRIKECTL